ncbi:MAG: hypothetical protein IPM66_04345 [Acidobacteriota bacterium]|nr:MAG: hypothetical protein IPM66_14590 [Acidobacteriota bacterium]QQS46486.1 MAG: hypothetical protein IPM66_21710 [Acidobacteriota bacterium]QQS47893.1 MAG: hypothetical protein IPM66_04345 [Acidobacteriota bacterium]
MNSRHLVIFDQQFFDGLHLRGCGSEPGHHGLFLDALDSMDRRQRVSFGQHGEAFDDRFLVVLLAVKNRSLGFGNRFAAGSTLPTLAALAGQAIFPNISGVHMPEIGTLFIPAKRAGMD